MAVHALAHARLTVLGNEPGDIILPDQVVQIMIRLQNHASAAPAIAPAGAALGDVSLAVERHTALAAMARACVDFNLVNEHAKMKTARPVTSP